jgi:hypothetical protein
MSDGASNSQSRRQLNRRKRKYPIRRTRPSNFLGLSNRHVARLRYVQEISLDPTTGGKAYHLFRANCLRDPDYTTAGHQPFGFDNLMLLYDHFTVVGSKISITPVYKLAQSNQNPCYIGIALSDNGNHVAGCSNVEHLLESHGTGGTHITGDYYSPMNPRAAGLPINKHFSARKFFRKQGIVGDSLYRGSTSGSPEELAYFEVFVASVYGNDPGVTYIKVQIDFLAVFTERKNITQS